MALILTNEYNTPITQELLDLYDEEIQEQFLCFVNEVPYIKNLISTNRKRVKDLPKDEQGRVIVDLENPHILEDMDYFRPSAIHFEKYGCYTKLRPNGNPKSEYGKWIREEYRRCFEGYVRESDGEWIPGDYYFFLNYCPILLTEDNGNNSKSGRRKVGFPRVWDGHYLMFHYLYRARNNGKHGFILASRSKGKSLSVASMLGKRFVLGEFKDVMKRVTSYITAADKSKLIGGDQTLNKFQAIIDHLAQNTEFPRKRLLSSLNDMTWTMGYKDLDTGTQKGSLNTVVGVSSADNASKLRGTRGVLYILEEAGCHLKGTEVLMYDGSIKKVEDVKIGDQLMGDDGTPRNVLELFSGVDDMYKISLLNGDYQVVNSKHPVYYKTFSWDKHTYTKHLDTAPNLMNKDTSKGYYISKSGNVNFPHKNVDIDPYWLGLWLGDGSSSEPTISNECVQILEQVEKYAKSEGAEVSKYYLKQSKACYNIYIKGKLKSTGKTLRAMLDNRNLLNNKHVPLDYKINSRDVLLKVIAGLIDSDGNLNKKKKYFEITQLYTRKHILDDISFMCRSLGFKTSMTSRIVGKSSKGSGHLNYRLRIMGKIEDIPTFMPSKQYSRVVTERNKRNFLDYSFKTSYYGKGEYYGFTVDGNNLFLLADFTIVHNTFSNLKKLYANLRPSVEEGQRAFGQIVGIGTAGDQESDFAGMQEIMYHPIGYRVQEVKNVYDRIGYGKEYFSYFFPGYMNYDGCYDENGNSDVVKALLIILQDRFQVKYNTSDVNAITKRIAEIPIVPQEAILRYGSNMFPITQINERIAQIDSNPAFYDDVYVGDLVLTKSGNVEFQITDKQPIRDFPLSMEENQRTEGALEIYEMPIKINGKIPEGRYIIGLDNYENDAAKSMSLGSMFVLDLFTDRIVAEYTGRPAFADDLNEKCRLLCLFYNARCLYESNKKNTYAYFSRMNSLSLLADTPEYLRQRQLIKYSNWGNSSKGVQATMPIKAFGLGLIRDWLLKPVVTEVTNDEGVTMQITLPNLYYIKSRALLRELASFNPDLNVDRIMALLQVMLYREEKMILYQGDMGRLNEEEEDKDYLGNDEFFTTNYDKRFSAKITMKILQQN